jgi:hypothetical protein
MVLTVLSFSMSSVLGLIMMGLFPTVEQQFKVERNVANIAK